MAGIILNPAQSSDLANDVYALTKLQSFDLAIIFLNRKYYGGFEFVSDNLMEVKTGGPGIIKCRTGFGFCSPGKKELEGNAYIIFRGTEYFLHSPGVIPGAEYHDMPKYLGNVKTHSWKGLSAMKPEKRTDAGIAQWLKQKGPVGITVTALDWLSDAIIFVKKKCISSAQSLIEKAMGASATIMDRIAYILNHGSTLEENISSWVVYLIRRIMSLLGQVRKVSQQDLNRQFIKNVFTQLQQKLNSIAQNALNQALVQGRAI